MFSVYWDAAANRAAEAAWNWPNSHAIEFTILSAVVGGLFTVAIVRIFHLSDTRWPQWLYRLEQLGLTAIAGTLSVFLATFLIFLTYDPVIQINKLSGQISELETKIITQDQRAFSFETEDFRRLGDETINGQFYDYQQFY
jgi:hypothetical protein